MKQNKPNIIAKRRLFPIGGTLLLAVVITLIIFFWKKEQEYNAALNAETEGNYQEAYLLYDSLGAYKKSREKKTKLESQMPALYLASAAENDVIHLGRFEQDGDQINGSEPLEWIVLDRRDNEILLLAKYAISCMPYNDDNEEVTWENSSLRQFLNDEFLNSAFTQEEIPLIKMTENENPDNQTYSTFGGNNTKDSIFLLSAEEASAYFHDEMARELNGMAEPTQYTLNQGMVVTDDPETEIFHCPWWLRGPGVYQNAAAFVDEKGSVYLNGAIVDNKDFFGVRPALWISLE